MSLIKLASPRWLKEFKSNPNLVNKFINAVQVDKFSPVKLTKNNMINRKLSKILFNNRSNDELKLPLKLRNNLTFKHNGKYIRQENNKNLINLEYDREEIKRYLDEGKLDSSVSPFRIMNPDHKTITLSHASITPDINNIKDFISKSSVADHYPFNYIYTGVDSPNNVFKHFKKQNKIKGKIYIHQAEIPARNSNLWYSAPTTLEQDSPEMILPFGHFKQYFTKTIEG